MYYSRCRRKPIKLCSSDEDFVVVEMVKRAKSKNRQFFVLRWSIFAGPVTYGTYIDNSLYKVAIVCLTEIKVPTDSELSSRNLPCSLNWSL